MQERLTIQQVGRYLDRELDDRTAREFELSLQADPLLMEEFIQKKLFFDSLSGYYRRQNLKKELSEIHSGIENRPELKTRLRNLYPLLRVAAMVSAVSVFLTTLVFIYLDHKPAESFRELSRDMERIKKDQQNIIRNIRKNETVSAAARPEKFEGTGFAISSNGYIATSYHLIKGSTQLTIESESGKAFEAKEVYSNPVYDIALLKITDSTFTGFDALPYGITTKGADIGEKIYTLGYPREDMVYGEGSISSNTGFEGDSASYQVSIPVNPGNSGGPVFDDRGNLVALITGKQWNSEGAAFAIKASYLLKTITEIPSDTLRRKIRLPRNVTASGSRTRQIKKFKDFVFVVKAA